MANKVKNTARKSTPKVHKAAKSIRPAAKPVFRAGTWLAVFMLAALIGFAYYLKKQKDAPSLEATPTSGITYIFTPEDGLPSGIEIVPAEGEAVKVEHGTDGLWKLSLPFETEAEQGSAQAAAEQISTLRMLGEVDAALDILGLDKPTHVINISFTGGKTHKLEVGSVTPTDSGYYTRVDGDRIVVLSKDGIDALLNLQASPPYLATPTASQSPLPPMGTPIPPTPTREIMPTPVTSIATPISSTPTHETIPVSFPPVRIVSHESPASSHVDLWLEFAFKPGDTLPGSQIESDLNSGSLELTLPSGEKKTLEQVPHSPADSEITNDLWLPEGIAVQKSPPPVGALPLNGLSFENYTNSPNGPQIRIPLEKLPDISTKGQYQISWQSSSLHSNTVIFEWDGTKISVHEP